MGATHDEGSGAPSGHLQPHVALSKTVGKIQSTAEAVVGSHVHEQSPKRVRESKLTVPWQYCGELMSYNAGSHAQLQPPTNRPFSKMASIRI